VDFEAAVDRVIGGIEKKYVKETVRGRDEVRLCERRVRLDCVEARKVRLSSREGRKVRLCHAMRQDQKSDCARGKSDCTRVKSGFARGKSDCARGKTGFARGKSDCARGKSDFARGKSDCAAGRKVRLCE
jgi:hypothetical protein